jgi:hypothetical protein
MTIGITIKVGIKIKITIRLTITIVSYCYAKATTCHADFLSPKKK